MRKQKMILISLITVTMILVLMPTSNAALQSNGSTPTTQIFNNWIINIRKMEGVGGTLGLTETLNSNLTSSSGSNNLDIHMIKNTEYGAIAILSASSYGNPSKITSGGTTTGNETGIVINFNGEQVAALNSKMNNDDYFMPNLYKAVNKYKNVYNNSSTYGPKIVGDAIIETKGWHGGLYDWFTGSNDFCNIIRARTNIYGEGGSIFAYTTSNTNNAYYDKANPSRAIMICGEGI